MVLLLSNTCFRPDITSTIYVYVCIYITPSTELGEEKAAGQPRTQELRGWAAGSRAQYGSA